MLSDDGATGGTDESKAGSDGAVEVGESNAVGRNDEQYPAPVSYTHLVSSAGGALAGGMLFGPLGAIVAGRTKVKKNRAVTNYLIFTYLADEGISYISFELTGQAQQKKINEMCIRDRFSPVSIKPL